MSRKHYQAMADKIKGEVEKLQQQGFQPGRQPQAFLHLKKAAELFADVALEDNERFDYHRFIQACGLPEIDEQVALVALQQEILAK
jgi:hypothetical protein